MDDLQILIVAVRLRPKGNWEKVEYIGAPEHSPKNKCWKVSGWRALADDEEGNERIVEDWFYVWAKDLENAN